MRNEYELDAMTSLSMATLPSVRVTEQCRCAVCDCNVPAGWYAVPIEGGGLACTASCASEIMDSFVPDDLDAERRIADLRDQAAELRGRADDLYSEADELEDEADELESAMRMGRGFNEARSKAGGNKW